MMAGGHKRKNFRDNTSKNNQNVDLAKKFNQKRILLPITVAMRSKVFGHSIFGMVGSNPAEGIDVRLLCLLCCVVIALCDVLIARSEDSCWLCMCECDLET